MIVGEGVVVDGDSAGALTFTLRRKGDVDPAGLIRRERQRCGAGGGIGDGKVTAAGEFRQN